LNQLGYREWKARMIPNLLYLRSSKTYLVSRSSRLFTNLYPYFYNKEGNKQLPHELLHLCKMPVFLSVLYLDIGSLCISRRINVLKKQIYLTPHICLYLQNYPLDDLLYLQEHIKQTYGINFRVNKRKDGLGHLLKLTRVSDTLRFLMLIEKSAKKCTKMNYKTNWKMRFEAEKSKLHEENPNFQILSSDSERWKNYNEEEVNKIIELKNDNNTDQAIANHLNRSYWSIVYKIRELRKDGRL
jgi:hypothetical protein